MEPFVVCRYCGEKNSRVFSKCQKCEGTLPRQWGSSSWEHVFSKSMKRCYSCNARIKSGAQYCPKCGQKQPQEAESLPHSQRKIDLEFTKDRKSLERAIHNLDEIFTNHTTYSSSSEDFLFDQNKTLYYNQKERFLQRNISNEMFYNHLKSLKEYLESIAIIPETRGELKPETHISFETVEKSFPSSIPIKEEIIRTESNYKEELTIINELKTLQFSPSPGRILYLLGQLKKKKNLSFEAITVVNTFRHHQDEEIRVVVYGFNEKVKKGKKQIRDPPSPTSPALIKETHIQKKFPTRESKEIMEKAPQEPVDLLDLSVSENLPETSYLESITDFDSSKEIVTEGPPLKPVSDEKRTLFSFLQYQVQDLIFEEEDKGTVVRLIPYSGSIKEIKVTIHQNQIIMAGCLKKTHLPLVNLELKTEGEPRQPSWDDPWNGIALIGEEKVLKRIKRRSEIANRFVSLGEAKVKVESQTKGEICLQLTCYETPEAIKIAYSLIKDLQLFFEISYY
jgi:ribosomal protein L40E